jgi:putative FmdB family regulatory protein
MPFYEYECQACKYYAEVMQKITDAPLERCPSCGKRRLKKLVSAPVFRLKGAGWYETDFKSDKETKRNLLGADQEESKPESKAEAAKEAKPAEAKEAKPAEAKGAPEAAAAREAGGSAGAAGKRRVATARAAAVRRPVRAAASRSTRKRRR